MSDLLKPCVECDELSDQSRCAGHRPKPAPRPNAKAKSRDYDTAWDNLSKRARKAQPFCLWCGATDDLQLDHTPTAWSRKLAGKTIRIQDVRVLCGPCNRQAGQARPGPGQRTIEDRDEHRILVSPTGRNLTPGGITPTRGGPTPGVRQTLSNSPGVSAECGLGEPW